MLKTIISFLLFTFFTQTVLAGIDLHNGLTNDSSFDIVEHYIDDHFSSTPCGLDSETDSDTNKMTFHSDKHDDVDDDHQHSCHGHTTSFPLANLSLLNLDSNRFYSNFPHVLTELSTVLGTAYRPPIVS